MSGGDGKNMNEDIEKYAKPMPVTDVLLAFPAGLGELLPPVDLIPTKLTVGGFDWRAWASDWFFGNLESFPAAKERIDATDAGRHLTCLMGSFEPKHEHKVDAVAWLASRWLKIPDKK